MVYISTAGVFNGLKDTPYHEWDDPCPLNTYGKTKYEGELMVERFTDEHFIVRAGWMVGGGRNKDHKFVAKILKQIDDGSSRLYAVGDKFGTPTYVPDFAECFLGLIQSGSYGRYHMACEGRGSRLDVAKLIVKALGRDDIAVIDVTSDHFAAEYPSIRPRSEIMQNMHLQLQGLNTMRPWQEAVEEYVRSAFGESLIPRQSDPADGVVLTPVDVSVKEGV
jgi:dTDP-4-dehydrorhamnose reductase